MLKKKKRLGCSGYEMQTWNSVQSQERIKLRWLQVQNAGPVSSVVPGERKAGMQREQNAGLKVSAVSGEKRIETVLQVPSLAPYIPN